MHHRGLLFCCCCFGSDDNTAERSLLKPSLFHKVAGSNPGGAQDEDSVKWWRQGWNSVREASERSEILMENYVGPKWKRFVRRCQAELKVICNSKPAKFHYDRVSYELNFDEGCKDFNDYKNEGFSKVSNEDRMKIVPRINV
ncbi:hypothetical protein SUGI_0897830 [Cryptomeria japonica]|nr:hypothetical protein SUGI_0897830 [Cryptomeria japonica]